MNRFHLNSFRWAGAGFLALSGAMMMVTPHQVQSFLASPLQTHIAIIGLVFLCVSAGELLITAFYPGRFVFGVVHLLAAGSFGLLAIMAAGDNNPILTTQFALFGAGMIVSAVILPQSPARPRRDEFLSLVMGAAVFVAGLTTLLSPTAFSHPFFSHLQNNRGLYGTAFVLIGAALVALQLLQRRGYAWADALETVILTLSGLAFLSILILDQPIQFRGLSSTYYAVFGLLLLTFPWLKRRIDRFSPRLLHTRLAMVLSIIVALTLIITFSIGTHREETFVRQRTLELQESRAMALAGSIQDRVQTYQNSLLTISRHTGLMYLPARQQAEHLAIMLSTFPDVEEVVLFDRDGLPVASGSSRMLSLTRERMQPIFQQVRTHHQIETQVDLSPELNRPVLRIGAPVFNLPGQFQGVVVASINLASLHEYLLEQSIYTNSQIYLIDEQGRPIDHPDPTLTAAFTDLKSLPPVAAALSSEPAPNTLSYWADSVEHMVGFAPASDLGWWVFVQQPVSTALLIIHQARDTILLLLMAFLLIIVLGGIFAANKLTAPLNILISAVDEFAAGNIAVQLPRSRLTEIDQLSQAFSNMRERLAARTLEQQRAERALRDAYDDLEVKVHERTLDLNQANLMLQHELEERTRAEEMLRKTNERLRFTTETIGLGLWEWEPHTQELYWNNTSRHLFGLPPDEEPTIVQIRDVILPQYLEPIETQVYLTIEKQEPLTVEYQIQLPDGSIRWMLSKGRCIYDEDGKPLRLLGITFDTTEQKLADAEMERKTSTLEARQRLLEHGEMERLQIARDLHDGPIQNLIAISYGLQEIQSDLKDPQQAEVLENIRQEVLSEINELRTITSEVRPPVLSGFGLSKAIQAHINQFKQQHPEMEVKLHLEPDGDKLPEQMLLALFRIYQECLNNIARHAQASKIEIRLNLDDEKVELEVSDNGVGFDTTGDFFALARRGHLGLIGMQERSEAIGGQLLIDSEPGKGTLVCVTAPRNL
jgi:PAS domain S-box-containing protein